MRTGQCHGMQPPLLAITAGMLHSGSDCLKAEQSQVAAPGHWWVQDEILMCREPQTPALCPGPGCGFPAWNLYLLPWVLLLENAGWFW